MKFPLSSITFSNNAISIGDYSFSNCSPLVKITMLSSNLAKIERNSFKNCSSLKKKKKRENNYLLL